MAGAVFPPCSLPRAKHGGGNEDNGDLLQKVPWKHCYTRAPSPAAGQHWPTPPLETPGHSQAGLGSVSCGVTACFSWVLVRTRFCLCPPRVYFPVLWVLAALWWGSRRPPPRGLYAMPKSAAPRAPAPAAVHCWPVPPQEMLKHSNTLERSK